MKRVAVKKVNMPDPSTVVLPVNRGRHSTGEYAELRARAMLMYLGAVQPLSLTDIKASPGFETLPYQTLEKWCNSDNWVARRVEFQKGVYAQVQSRIGDKLVQSILQNLADLDPIKKQLSDHIALADFSSVHGDKLVMAYCKVLEVQARFTEQAVGLMTPKAEAGNGNPTQGASAQDKDGAVSVGSKVPDGGITDEEARAAARAIMRLRRDAHEGGAVPPAASGK